MVLSGIGLVLVIGVLFEARVTLGATAWGGARRVSPRVILRAIIVGVAPEESLRQASGEMLRRTLNDEAPAKDTAS